MAKNYLDFLKADRPAKEEKSTVIINEDWDAEIEDVIEEMNSNRELFSESDLLAEVEPISFGLGAAAATGATQLIVWAHKKYMEAYGKANEACAKLKGKEGAMCRKQYKIKASKAELQALKYARSQCGKNQDKDKMRSCLKGINTKIKTIQDRNPETRFKED